MRTPILVPERHTRHARSSRRWRVDPGAWPGRAWHYARTMQTPADAWRFLRMLRQVQLGRVSAHPSAIRVRSVGGVPMLCRANEDVFTFKHTFFWQYHLPPVTLPEHAVIVDLGANVGFTVAHLAHRYPRARVVGVEMDAENVRLAALNTASFGARVELIHAAIWTSDGTVAYGGDRVDGYQVVENGTVDDAVPTETLASAAPEAQQRNGRVAAPRVAPRRSPARKLTTILDACGIERVDYLKIDIEGAEVGLVAAWRDWAARVASLKVEIHPPASVQDVRRVLEQAGYRWWLDGQHPACVCAAM